MNVFLKIGLAFFDYGEPITDDFQTKDVTITDFRVESDTQYLPKEEGRYYKKLVDERKVLSR